MILITSDLLCIEKIIIIQPWILLMFFRMYESFKCSVLNRVLPATLGWRIGGTCEIFMGKFACWQNTAGYTKKLTKCMCSDSQNFSASLAVNFPVTPSSTVQLVWSILQDISSVPSPMTEKIIYLKLLFINLWRIKTENEETCVQLESCLSYILIFKFLNRK